MIRKTLDLWVVVFFCFFFVFCVFVVFDCFGFVCLFLLLFLFWGGGLVFWGFVCFLDYLGFGVVFIRFRFGLMGFGFHEVLVWFNGF